MRFWNFTQDPDELGDGILDVDGEIVAERGWFTGDGACVAKDFVKALNGYRNVTVHVNSPGGDVMAGAAIYSALREHSMNGKGTVTVIVTALAASAASIVAMAGDRILMHPVAYMMIHNPWTMAVGDAKELRKTAKTLDAISEGLISAYEQKTGKTRDELKKMLDNETWMSAVTAVEEGFADEVLTCDAGTRRSAASARVLGVQSIFGMRSHGINEILERVRDQDPDKHRCGDEDEPEDPEEPEENPADPEDPEELDGDPEETKKEKDKRNEIARRAMIAAMALD